MDNSIDYSPLIRVKSATIQSDIIQFNRLPEGHPTKDDLRMKIAKYFNRVNSTRSNLFSFS